MYILGKAIDTPLGKCNFILVDDYDKVLVLSPYLTKNKQETINDIGVALMKQQETNSDITMEMITLTLEDCNKLNLLQLIRQTDLEDIYNEIFNMCFEEKGMFDKILTEEDFELYRELLRNMNCINYEKTNPNPEIEKFNQYKKLYNNKQGGGVSIEGMLTSVEVACGENPNSMTIYKLHALFSRIGQFKSNEATTLFRTVGDIPIINWYEDIEKEEPQQLDDQSKKIIEEFRNTGQRNDNYQSLSQIAEK